MPELPEFKEALVDFAAWNWHDAGIYYGPFSVTFTAQDLAGIIVHQKTVIVYVAKWFSTRLSGRFGPERTVGSRSAWLPTQLLISLRK